MVVVVVMILVLVLVLVQTGCIKWQLGSLATVAVAAATVAADAWNVKRYTQQATGQHKLSVTVSVAGDGGNWRIDAAPSAQRHDSLPMIIIGL